MLVICSTSSGVNTFFSASLSKIAISFSERKLFSTARLPISAELIAPAVLSLIKPPAKPLANWLNADTVCFWASVSWLKFALIYC